MQLQYISDNQGHTTAVQIQIPIEDWNELKKKYVEFEEEEKAVSFDIPQWQIDLVRKEVQAVKDGTAELTDWETARKSFKH